MANVQRPGFLPAQTAGTDFTFTRFPAGSAASAIRKGDAVTWATAAMALSASAATAVAGASLGASYKNADGERYDSPTLPSTTFSGTDVFAEDRNWIYLPDDVNTVYVASCDEAIAWTDVNLNYQMVLGSTTSVYSDHELDATSRGTTATLPWRVTGFVDTPSSDADAADAAVYCKVNAGFNSPALTVTGTA